MRYVSADRTIAAAGAAFAWVDDDAEARAIRRRTSRFRRMVARVLLAFGFIVA
jgi:hypothetical protein